MKVKITHDGAFGVRGTSIVNAETGEPLERVTRIDINIDATEGISAIVYIEGVELDVNVHADLEHEQTLIYDPEDNESLDDAIAILQEQRAARDRT